MNTQQNQLIRPADFQHGLEKLRAENTVLIFFSSLISFLVGVSMAAHSLSHPPALGIISGFVVPALIIGSFFGLRREIDYLSRTLRAEFDRD